MFPYPSGALHLGHLRIYTLSDLLSRHAKLLNRSVLHPIGWDAFGLPAENAAIKSKQSPALWTRNNIASMKHSLLQMGIDFDWDRVCFKKISFEGIGYITCILLQMDTISLSQIISPRARVSKKSVGELGSVRSDSPCE